MAAEEPHPREVDDFSERLDLHLTGIQEAFDAIVASQQQILELIELIVDERRAGS